jgi:RHS repeat-associated protein
LFPSAINGPGNTRSFSYDGLDRPVGQQSDLRIGGTGSGMLDTTNPFNPDGRVLVSYAWDGNSRLTGITDDNGNRTTFNYDALNRRIRQVNAKTDEITTWTYDRDGNLLRVVDPNGTESVRSYDAVNRLLGVAINRAAGVGGTTTETYQYDGYHRRVRATDNNGSTTAAEIIECVYDSLGRMLEERANGQVFSAVFTGDGKRVRTTYPGGRVIAHTFDALDRVLQVQDATAGEPAALTSSDWIGSGYRELRRQNANGTVLTFLNDAANADTGYDSVRRVRRMRILSTGGAPIVDREHAYNRADMRVLERRHDDNALVDIYSYDSAYRVAGTALDEEGAGTTRDVQALAYTYDGVGNRRAVNETASSSGLRVTTYAINQVNEYTSVGGALRVHSRNGNLLDDGTKTYVYDYKNRLTEVRNRSDGALIANYRYDAENRRTAKIANGSEARYIYDGWRVCEEQNAGGATLVTYVYSPTYIDAPVQVQRTAAHPLGPAAVHLHQNARADVVAVTDAAGSVIERRTYDGFGRAVDAAKEPVLESAVGNPFGFQGARLDPETGFYYLRNRYYDPATGRFLQRDPVWDEANVGNQYTFAANSPISRGDPLGLDGVTIHLGVSASGGVVAGGGGGAGFVLQLGGEEGGVDFGFYRSTAVGTYVSASGGASLDFGITGGTIETFRDTDRTIGGSCPVGGFSVDVEDDDQRIRTVRLSVGPDAIGPVPAAAYDLRTSTTTGTFGDIITQMQYAKGEGVDPRGAGFKHEEGDVNDPAFIQMLKERTDRRILREREFERRRKCEEEAKKQRQAEIRKAEEARLKRRDEADAERQRQEEARRRAEQEARKKKQEQKERDFDEGLRRGGQTREDHDRETERRGMNRPVHDQRTGRRLP